MQFFNEREERIEHTKKRVWIFLLVCFCFTFIPLLVYYAFFHLEPFLCFLCFAKHLKIFSFLLIFFFHLHCVDAFVVVAQRIIRHFYTLCTFSFLVLIFFFALLFRNEKKKEFLKCIRDPTQGRNTSSDIMRFTAIMCSNCISAH